MDEITTGAALVVANKLLGKTAEEISKDIAHIYVKGRDKIVDVATRKTANINDGKWANLRVTRDVFWGGSYTDESICAEYFGGILTSSRSKDGKDDTGVYYVDIIKALSSAQLHLHYSIYRSLNKLLLADDRRANLNAGLDSDVHGIKLYLSLEGLIDLGLKLDTDLECLYRKGLLHKYNYGEAKVDNKTFGYVMIIPTTLGIQLLSIANNMFEHWKEYPRKDFGDFQDIKAPRLFAASLENLSERLDQIV